VQHSAWSHREI